VRRKALLIWRGTGISNPSRSSAESAANLTHSITMPTSALSGFGHRNFRGDAAALGKRQKELLEELA
jgi:hypothetical protein